MKRERDNIGIICGCLLLYFLNQLFKKKIKLQVVSIVLRNYLNDTICGCLIIAYTNLILSLHNKRLNRLLHIIAFNFFCGMFWEFVIPIFRSERVSDYRDIVAYIIGGVVYWMFYIVKG